MDNKRLDEAVEVAVAASRAHWQSVGIVMNDHSAMRAALLASLPVLLGEPVAWLWSHPSVNDGEWIDSRVPPSDEHRLVGWIGKPLYAPSLGEGDGR